MYRFLIIILLFFSFTQAAECPGATFLLIWPGARATSMAGAFSAVADDATSCYYNQAGLAFINKTMLTFQHAPWLSGLHESVYFEYFSFVTRFKTGALGFQIADIYEIPDDVINLHALFYPGYRPFLGLNISLNYGQKLSPNLGIGFSSKFVYDHLVAPWIWGKMPQLGIQSGSIGISWAIDVGLLYKPFCPFCLSLAFQNFGPDLKYTESGASDPLPYTLRLGMKLQAMETKKIHVMLTGEATKVYEIDEIWKAVGMEIGYINTFFLRGGYFIDSEGERVGFTYGGGIKIRYLSVDLGFDEAIYDFETDNYKISFSYQF